MAHKLKIVVDDMLQDPRYIRVSDWSDYDSRMSVTNRVLKIDVPGQDTFKLVTLPQSKSATYTTKSLKILKEVADLPDGMYRLTYSICPNERKFTIVEHFRTVVLQNKIMGLSAKLMGCTFSEQTINQLAICHLNISALKANVIDEYNIQKAYDLYAETESIFSNLYKASL